jgi:uncharacterized protein YdaU (DUF1376 family)
MKSPAFQFYPGDFLGGSVATYSLDEIGLYTVLLAFDWNLNGLPTEPEKLAKLARISTRKLASLWVTVKENFVEREGRYHNPRLDLERAKQEENRKKKVDAANSRWNAPAHAPALQTQSPSSSIALSSTQQQQEASPRSRLRLPRTLPPSWVAEGLAWWLPNVGAMKPARFQSALSGVVEANGWPAVFTDAKAWVAAKKTAGKATKLEWYAEEASARLTRVEPPLWDYERECLTDYGERATRPVSA